jgi:hypothetical protein
MWRGLTLAREMAAAAPETAAPLYEALASPFSLRALEQERRISRVLVARSGGLWDRCREAMAPLEQYLPWRADLLRARAECYARAGDPRAARADADLQGFLAAHRAPPASPAPAAPPAAAGAGEAPSPPGASTVPR